jgi:hypothetical protein
MPQLDVPPNAVWVWMTLLGVTPPMAAETMRFFLAHDISLETSGKMAHGIDAALALREDNPGPIKKATLKWHLVGGVFQAIDRMGDVQAKGQFSGEGSDRLNICS